MKTERRHELQTNALADTLGHAVDSVRPYTQILVGGVLAALVIFGAVKYFSVRSQEEVVDSWNLYLQASTSNSTESADELNRLIEQYPGTTAAQWSHLFLADQALNEGIGQLFQNRAESKDKLRKAEEHYLAVQKGASDPLLLERATLGLARVYESQVDLTKAAQEYQRLLERWPEGAFASTAKERLDDLSQKSTKQFYDWFASNEPKGAADGGLGAPGSRPEFNLDAEQPDINLNLNPSNTPADNTDKTSQKEGDATEPVSTASRVTPESNTPPKSEP